MLQRDEEVYLQAIGSAQKGFYLEFRDGSEASHFQACGAPLSLAAATEAFQLYRADDPGWRTRVPWEPWEGGVSSGKRPLLPQMLLAVLAVSVLAALVWRMVVNLGSVR